MARGLRLPVNFNGTEYGATSIQAIVMGQAIPLTGFKYSESMDAENLYSIGSDNSTGTAYGHIKVEASIKMYASTFEALMASARSAGYDKIQDLPEFEIVMLWRPNDTAKFVRHRLVGCTILENIREVGKDDMSVEVESKLLFQYMEWSF